MRIPRIFYPFEKEEKNSINLDIASSHHLKVINIKKKRLCGWCNGKGESSEARFLNLQGNSTARCYSPCVHSSVPTSLINLYLLATER